jgi:hypothetical protein
MTPVHSPAVVMAPMHPPVSAMTPMHPPTSAMTPMHPPASYFILFESAPHLSMDNLPELQILDVPVPDHVERNQPTVCLGASSQLGVDPLFRLVSSGIGNGINRLCGSNVAGVADRSCAASRMTSCRQVLGSTFWRVGM